MPFSDKGKPSRKREISLFRSRSKEKSEKDAMCAETLTVYAQKIYEGKNRLYLGEDALPYADGELLIVADGLGGRGGYPHADVDKRIVERDGFYNLVFAPVFGETDDAFKEYVLKNFSEIFATREYYFSDENALKTSGYFASRLASAIAVYELKYAEGRKSIDELLNDGRGAQTAIGEYADSLARAISEKMSAIAKEINLVNESRIQGAKLLPSTLQVAYYKENAHTVDVIYFWAGDSRAYVWDADGLGLVTDDHETAEAMTNIVNLTDRFVLESRHVVFKKPCVLFNVTDGCYKCGTFFTPMHFERYFLEIMASSANREDASKKLEAFFEKNGRHDDSNSMAMALVGYDGFESFKMAANIRLKFISDSIVKRLPDIFQKNHDAELEAARLEIERIVLPKGTEWVTDKNVREYIVERMRKEKYKYFLDAEAESEHVESEEKGSADTDMRQADALVPEDGPADDASPVISSLRVGAAGDEPPEADTAEGVGMDASSHKPAKTQTPLEKVAPSEANAPKEKVKGVVAEKGDERKERESSYIKEKRRRSPTEADRITGLTEEREVKPAFSGRPSARRYFSLLCALMKRALIKKCRISAAETRDDRAEGVSDAEMTDVELIATGEYHGLVVRKIPAARATTAKEGAGENAPPTDAIGESEEQTDKKISDEEKNAHAERYSACINRYWRANRNSVMRDIWFERREILPQAVREEIEKETEIPERRYKELAAQCAVMQKLTDEYRQTYTRYYKESKI